ncbi:hypothetical protein LOK49_LG10G00230 [Camellia lanceoleosa]|uniref:Uncharacterized protein n=1 Tax=Camellia lanceoleosa TaxID=1840588 RepID=A0ACC0GA10_9ERIC|nr:hypothetical protein LOK49_LG10G00230 [Camellia lanceoleosa]
MLTIPMLRSAFVVACMERGEKCRCATNHSEEPRENYDNVKFTEHTTVTHARAINGPWKEDGLDRKPCWTKPVWVSHLSPRDS